MSSSKLVSRRCIGVFIIFGCIFLVLYHLAVHPVTAPFLQILHSDRVFGTCQEDRRILRTAESTGFCLGTHNIFFVETANSKLLNPRQACAIESAARHHPMYNIMVLMTPTDAIDFENQLMKVLISIDNVLPVKIDITTLVYGTPYFEWYMSNIWNNSKFKITHMSDAMRFFLLWTFGGMYLDMDVVVLRPLSTLRNTVVKERSDTTGSSVLFFDRGHEFLFRCMVDFISHYDPTQFATNGPYLINRNIKKYCLVDNLVNVGKARCGVDVLPQDRAYPIPYERWKDYFSQTNLTSLSQRFNNSYLIHAWNFLSSKKPIVIGGNSLYEVAMKEHCPLVYKYAQQFTNV